MNRYRAPVVAEPQPLVKPEGKRLRRKLQKIVSHKRNSTQPTNADIARPIQTQDSNKSPSVPEKVVPIKAVPRSLPSLSLPPDLSDSKWAEYLWKSGIITDDVDPLLLGSSQKSPSHALNVIPEFAHLSVSDAKPRKLSGIGPSVSPSTISTRSSLGSGMRRYAKTPVLRIGQLEALAVGDQATAQQDVSSVELLAESYRALLDSRCSFMTDRFYDASESLDQEPYGFEVKPDLGSSDLPVRTVVDIPLTPKGDMGSPTSDDGTLVGFEEDTIYLKPVSFSPEARSPCPNGNESSRIITSMVSTIPDDPSLKICFDLLTRELSSAVSDSPVRPSAETSALQIWVMIEAYEKLRNQVQEMSLEAGHARSIQSMFDMWLRSLYTIHDGMTGNGGQRSESDYGDQLSETSD
ncbi:hypothetical protein BJ170DRAFT_166332 [Xylariales sp. AK1849]|nr:hypothetical protein BJ170DRAFT_166332 [Xylariales sp. AK1849]